MRTHNIFNNFINANFLIKSLVILLIMTIGILMRVDQYNLWSYIHHGYIYQGIPLVTNIDSYYYMLLGKDLVNNNYSYLNELRVFPDNPENPSIPPLLSLLSAFIAEKFQLSINAIAAYLPVFLGTLIVFPMYYLGKNIGNNITAISAALFCVLSPFYLYRSGLGWFDTDILIITFILSLVAIIYNFNSKNTLRFNIALASFYFFVFLLFFFWWDQAQFVVFFFAVYPLLIKLFFNRKDSRLLTVLFITILLISTISVINTNIIDNVIGIFNYVIKTPVEIYPNSGLSIGEQKPLLLKDAINLSSGHLTVFLISILGILILIKSSFKSFVYLLPIFILGVGSVIVAARFLIFFIPIISLGLGMVISTISEYKDRLIYQICGLILFIIIAATLIIHEDELYSAPIVKSDLIEHLIDIKETTQPNSVIWNWCDFGYPISYWSERATICDGSSHGGRRAYYAALPFTTHSFSFSANLINFHIKHGIKGQEKLLGLFDRDLIKTREFLVNIFSSSSSDAEYLLQNSYPHLLQKIELTELVKFLFPQNSRDIYLYIDLQTMNAFPWLNWFSSWNPEIHKGVQPFYRIFHDTSLDNNILSNPEGLKANINNGNLIYQNQLTVLKEINFINTKDDMKKIFSDNNGGILDYHDKGNFAVLLDKHTYNSVAHQLFIHKTKTKYFTLITDDSALYQLWKVNTNYEVNR